MDDRGKFGPFSNPGMPRYDRPRRLGWQALCLALSGDGRGHVCSWFEHLHHRRRRLRPETVLFGDGSQRKSRAAGCKAAENRHRQPESRLADLPIASGNFPAGAIVFKKRYILLVGGYQYSNTLGPDGKIGPLYGTPQRRYPNNPMCSGIFVYDTSNAVFGRATSLILNNNLPMTVIHGDRMHLIGGEIQGAVIDQEHLGHHPDLYLAGAIRRGK